MNYRKCLRCGFNVTPQEERCLDCGVLHPLQSLTVKGEDYSFIIALGVLAALIVPALYYGSQEGVSGFIICAFPVALIIFVGISKAVSDALSRRSQKLAEREVANRTASYPESLAYKENIIEQRTSELSKREQQVNAVLERARLSTGEKWEQVRVTLEDSIQTLKRQHARYSAKSVEIDTVRLQNKLAPFVYNNDRFTYDQIDSHLKTIERAEHNAGKLGEQLDEQRRVLGSVTDLEEVSQRLSEFQESTQKLRDALIGQQAVLAL